MLTFGCWASPAHTNTPSSLAQASALRKVHDSIDVAWTDAADYITIIEDLCERDSFADRQLAAAVASKVRVKRQLACVALPAALLSPPASRRFSTTWRSMKRL